ncbi:MAG: hypothetical protein M1536_05190 [Firmicutes bacterium]|nr:hypothetical protein [Bacillota bacterium]
MRIAIFPLKKTPAGKVPGELQTALVELAGEETVYHCYSEALKARLEKIFSEPLNIIVPLKNDLSVLSHARVEIQPSTKEFFEQIVFFLGKHGLYGKIVE